MPKCGSRVFFECFHFMHTWCVVVRCSLQNLFSTLLQLHNGTKYNEASCHNKAIRIVFVPVLSNWTCNNILCHGTSKMKQLLKTEGPVDDGETCRFLCLLSLLLSKAGHIKWSKICFVFYLWSFGKDVGKAKSRESKWMKGVLLNKQSSQVPISLCDWS